MPKLKSNVILFDEKAKLLSNDMMDIKSCDSANDRASSYIPEGIPKQSAVAGGASAKAKTHHRTSSSTTTSSTSGSGVKPNTILSLEDRDIVVIDHVDYKESINNESEVIVVEKPHLLQQQHQHDIDLADLLGQNWPSIAGVLNNTATPKMTNNSSGPYMMNGGSISTPLSNYLSSGSAPNATIMERNKSKNPLSHFGQSKVKRFTQNLINFDGDAAGSEVSRRKENAYHTYDVPSKKSQLQPAAATTSATATAQKHQLPTATSQKQQSTAQHSPALPLSQPLGSATVKSDYLTTLGLDIGSMAEISRENCDSAYGVIRWIGYLPSTKILTVGVELEDEQLLPLPDINDGSINGVRLFKCPPGRALFVSPEQCSVDRRFQDVKMPSSRKSSLTTAEKDKERQAAENFGHINCPLVEGAVPPLKIVKLVDLEAVAGKFKGIQGHYNSCYLDATLFAMFTFTCVFDSLLFRPPDDEDIGSYQEVQTVLREEIVNPLRKNLFVRADRVMKLRELLEKLSSVTGLTCEEKDPEEFLNSLLTQIMRAEPFLKLSSGQDAFYYQLFVEKDERLSFPTVQQLFEQSFMASDIKLKEVPSCLIIQMPRFGKNFKMYPRILPSQVLDVTDIIEGSPRQCCVCGKWAELECKECYGSIQFGAGLESTSFCKTCLEKVHSHDKRTNHQPRELIVSPDFLCMAEHLTVPRIFMELFAVVCIETSHYVAFVKSGSGLDAPWCFFDSMADRKGEQNGYNIPEIVSVPNLPMWLSEEGSKELNERYLIDKSLPEHAKRLMCDAYMCIYQTDVMMYR